MRIALVYPQYYDIAHFGAKRKEIPPFGVLYLASIIEKKGACVEVFAVANEKTIFDFSSFDIIGFSLPSSVTYPLMRKIKTNSIINENSILIAGGIHASLYPESVVNELGIHIACIGEGEETIGEIIDNSTSKSFEKIKGIVYSKNGLLYRTKKREPIRNLNKLPFPSRKHLSIVDIVMHDRLSSTTLPVAHILCSRGCPYKCYFCANQDKNIRYRSSKNIKEELITLINEYGIKGFCITDDNFVINKSNVLDICSEISNLNLKWSSLSRVNTVDKELLNAMKNSGCVEIKFGIESGSQRILDAMNKNITIEQVRNAINATYELGINIKAFILHGFPGENLESTYETISLLNELKSKIDRISLFRFVPLPGSYVYKNPKKYNLTLPESYKDIFIYNNDHKWWGSEKDKKELDLAYNILEKFIKDNWEKY